MKNRLIVLAFIVSLSSIVQAQQITFSEPYREDSQNMSFEILGKMNGHTVIFKNARLKYAINFFNDSMRLVKQASLGYLPAKTFNIDCIAYQDYIWLVYQYQKKGTLYCMAQQLDAQGEKLHNPIELDTTHIGSLGDNKIYSTIFSDDKKNILVFKVQRSDDYAHFVTKLFNNQMQLSHQTRFAMPFDNNRNTFGDFFVDNEGNMAFTNAQRKNSRDEASSIFLLVKPPMQDSIKMVKLPFDSAYADEVKMKIDNLNKRYIISTFYYSERRGNIEGIYNFIWDAAAHSTYGFLFSEFSEELRAVAKSSGSNKAAFNDFFLKNIVLKRDGSFIITAEDQTSQGSGNNAFNRYDYLYGNPYYSPYNYYLYTPSYYGYYRPFNNFGSQGMRYYNDNILILNISKTGVPEWTNILHKQQVSDDNDNYISYTTFNTAGEIHFLFNDISKRDKQLSDNIISPGGEIKRNPTLRTYEKGFEFMPKFAKQVAARQVIVPCTYRGQFCFAKIDF